MRPTMPIAMRSMKYLAPWLLPLCVNAQTFTNNGAAITFTAGADVQVNGDLVNDGSGLLLNDGTLTLTGNFSHNASNSCFGASQGEVVMNGAAQSIGGSSMAIFNDLTLAGTGTKTLLREAEVGGAYATPAGVLHIADRQLDLNGSDITVRNPSPSAVQRTTGYIISERDPVMGHSYLRWNIGEAGTGSSYTFPFGNGATNQYLPFNATLTMPGTGTGGYLSMATYPTVTLASPNNRPLPGGLTTLIDASGVENAPHVLDRWWMMVTEGYSTAPQANTSFTYRDGEWNTGTNMIVESTLELERFIGTQWQMLPTVISTGTNNLSTNAQPLVSSIWTAAELASPLPIELISLTGQRLNDQVVILNWLTATERNNAGFEVWRMIEGEAEFSEVGWVSGAGDSQGSIAYEIMDGNVAQVTSYYQLKQIDHDGEYAWTPVVAVAGAEPIGRFFAYPNPASDRVQLAGLPANAIGVTMHDASGRLVRHWGATQNIGGLHELQRGTYMISAMDEDGSVITTRLVLE